MKVSPPVKFDHSYFIDPAHIDADKCRAEAKQYAKQGLRSRLHFHRHAQPCARFDHETYEPEEEGV